MSILAYTKMMLNPSSAPGRTTEKPGPFLDRDVHKVLGIKEIILNNDTEQSVLIRLLIRKIGKKLINGSQNGPGTMFDA